MYQKGRIGGKHVFTMWCVQSTSRYDLSVVLGVNAMRCVTVVLLGATMLRMNYTEFKCDGSRVTQYGQINVSCIAMTDFTRLDRSRENTGKPSRKKCWMERTDTSYHYNLFFYVEIFVPVPFSQGHHSRFQSWIQDPRGWPPNRTDVRQSCSEIRAAVFTI